MRSWYGPGDVRDPLLGDLVELGLCGRETEEYGAVTGVWTVKATRVRIVPYSSFCRIAPCRPETQSLQGLLIADDHRSGACTLLCNGETQGTLVTLNPIELSLGSWHSWRLRRLSLHR